MTDDWTATIAAERMKVDNQFADRLEASSFSRQQWGLVMTAMSFDIQNPSNPGEARLVPDTSSVPAIMPELDRIERQGPMGGGSRSSGSGGGLLDSVKGALGFGDGTDERLDEATELAEEYCDRLQQALESNGRWEDVCRRAQK